MAADLLTTTVDFTPTRQSARARLDAFMGQVASPYRNERNFDYGPTDRSNVSALSPWVSHGLINERDICQAVLSRYALSSTEKFIQEVLWRTYWKGWLELRPTVYGRYRRGVEQAIAALDKSAHQRSAYEAAIAGNTGIDCFDAWAKELIAHGYLHNHARMWFASIWIFTLRLDWHLGADFFYRHLMDGDSASNTLSWRWVAGLQTRGKHYVARADNIEKFTAGRFSPQGLNENPIALDDAPFDDPIALRFELQANQTANTFVLLTDDDCTFVPNVDGDAIVGAAAISTVKSRSLLPVGDAIAQFNNGALEEAKRLFEEHFSVVPVQCNVDDLVQQVTQSGATQLLLPWPTAGTTRTALNPGLSTLRQQGIHIVEQRRNWDSRAWPQATKGFFPFKEKIPQMLLDAGLQVRKHR